MGMSKCIDCGKDLGIFSSIKKCAECEAAKIKADYWIKSGDHQSEQNKNEDALDAYTKAIQFQPNYWRAWYSKGSILNKLDEYDEALKAFNRALEINPNEPKLWSSKGFTLKRLGQFEEALNAFNRGLEINPNCEDWWIEKGAIFSKLKRYEDALNAFNRAIQLNPKNAGNWILKGVPLFYLGRYGEALEVLNQALEIDPSKNGTIWYLMAGNYEKLGEIQNALNAINRSIELYPNDVMYNNFKNEMLDELAPQFEPIFTKLNQTGNLQYIENFCKKFPNCKRGTPDFSKLHQLLEKKGCSLSDEKLNFIVEIVSRQQALKMFKAKMLNNNPKTSEDLIRNFLEVYGENYNQFIEDILKILSDDFNYGEQDIRIDISRIRKEIELKNFESSLSSDSHKGERLTINDVDKISGYEFEILLKRLFESIGYSVTHTNLSNDQGADLIIEKFGERTVVQAKNWQNNVDNSAVQEVFTAINHYKANKSLVISSSGFTNGAIELAQSNNVELWDREKLSKMLKENPIFKK